MRKYRYHILGVVAIVLLTTIALSSSTSSKSDSDSEVAIAESKSIKRTRFNGNYNTTFNDLQKLHMEAAKRKGIKPPSTVEEAKKIKAKQLKRLPEEMELYKTYKLTHSIPYLTPSAAKLFIEISDSFRDSLQSKGLPLYRLYLTSVLRTEEHVKKLGKSNTNAAQESAHSYGTTFDISWKRFDKVDYKQEDNMTPDKLKFILGQVLYDFKKLERCYIKHEKKQACFHITER